MKTEQNRKHRSQIRLWGLSFTVIMLMLVASVANASGSSSVITLITVVTTKDPDGNTILNTSNGNSTFSSVTSDGKNVAFDSYAKDLNESNGDTTFSDIFLSVDNGAGTKTIHRIAGSDSGDTATRNCQQAPDRCNSGFPVISHNHQAGNANIYDVVFSSSAKLGDNDLPGSCGMFGFNCKSIFLAKVDLTDPSNPVIKQVSVGISGSTLVAETGNSGYQDLSTITPINVLHPVAGVYECQDTCQLDPLHSGTTAKAGDAVVVFESDANNLVTGYRNKHKQIFLRDMGDGTSAPGATIPLTFKGTDKLEPNGDSSNPVITDDGKYVAFVSTAKNLVAGVTTSNPKVYLLDIAANKFYLVSRDITLNAAGDGESRYPSIIENGSVVEVAFHSTSTNLASEAKNGIANIYVFSINTADPLKSQQLDLVSRGSSPNHTVNAGDVGNMDSLTPYLSSNGGAVTFSSYADNLIEGANNYDCPVITLRGQQVTKCKDIYVSDLSAHQTWRVSLTSTGEQAQSNSAFPALSGDGALVSFTSYVDIFGTGGQDYHMQIYQRDQGVPLGNPVIQPSSWSFYAQVNQTSSRTFTVTSLSPTTQLLSKDGSYTGLTLDQKILVDGKWVDEVADETDNFKLDKLTCTDGKNLLTYQSCTFQVTFKAVDMGGKSAVLYVPIYDDRQAIAISLQGRTIVSYLPLMLLH